MTQHDKDDAQVDARTPYEAPSLVRLGSLSELTLGDFGGNEDGLSGNFISEILP